MPQRTSPRLRSAVVAGGAAAALLAASAPASAAEATAKASGTTTVKLSASVKSTMKRAKISLSGVSPARRGATAVKLPLTSATIDPEAGSGTLNHKGALRFKRRGRSITLKTIRLTLTPSQATVTAAIGSSRVRIATVDTSGVKITQARKRLKLSDLQVELTAIGASRLNRALRIQRFKPGQPLGATSAVIDTPAGTNGTGGGTAGSNLKSGTSTLTLTPEARAGLAGSGATIGTAAPATGSGAGPYAFPIAGGALDASRNFAGSVPLAGSLLLSAQGNTLTLKDPIVDLAGSVVTAEVNGSRVPAFALDLAGMRNVRYDGQLVLDGITVRRATSGPLADPEGKPSGVIGTLRIDARTD